MSKVFILADFSGEKASKTTAELATAGARIGFYLLCASVFC